MRTLLFLFVFLLLMLFVVAFNIFIIVSLLSMAIVPLTWIYSKVVGRSYNFVMDQSEIIYKLNKFGQWSLMIGGAVLLFKFV